MNAGTGVRIVLPGGQAGPVHDLDGWIERRTTRSVGLLDLKTLASIVRCFPARNATYLQSGHVLFFHAGVWHIVPFDATAGRTTGDPVTVARRRAAASMRTAAIRRSLLSVSDNGTAGVSVGHGIHSNHEFVWIDRAGRLESLGLPAHKMVDASIAPDGRRVAVGRMEGGTYELWMDDVARKTEDRLDIKGSNFAKAMWRSARQRDRVRL